MACNNCKNQGETAYYSGEGHWRTKPDANDGIARSRNRRTVSRTQRNYAPRLASSWLCHSGVCMSIRPCISTVVRFRWGGGICGHPAGILMPSRRRLRIATCGRGMCVVFVSRCLAVIVTEIFHYTQCRRIYGDSVCEASVAAIHRQRRRSDEVYSTVHGCRR